MFLQQGTSHQRPPIQKSQAYEGIQPLSPLIHTVQRFQPLPQPIGLPPYHFDIKNVVPDVDALTTSVQKLIFHVVGDVGGINQSQFQNAVATQMMNDIDNLPQNQKPLFFYITGDVVYYNGQYQDYYAQFYDPYHYYNAPILSIPGNHDGDPINASQTSLDGWVKYFMTAQPHVDPASHDAPRVTISLPNVYHTITAPYATIVGLYTNVPEGGSVDSHQQQWLTNELHTAPTDKALIVALHHPIYSFDNHHSGSPNMGHVLSHAINASKRIPNLIATAHVHNYQRIEKAIHKNSITPFLVAGLGGYPNLHQLTVSNGFTDPSTNAKLIFGNDTSHGYVTLSVDSNAINGSVTLIDDATGTITKEADSFSYTAKALYLAEGETAVL